MRNPGQLAKTMKRAGSFAGVKAHFFSGVGAVGNCVNLPASTHTDEDFSRVFWDAMDCARVY